LNVSAIRCPFALWGCVAKNFFIAEFGLKSQYPIKSIGSFVIHLYGNFSEFARLYSHAVYTVLPVKLVGKQAFLFLYKDGVFPRGQFHPKTPFAVAFSLLY